MNDEQVGLALGTLPGDLQHHVRVDGHHRHVDDFETRLRVAFLQHDFEHARKAHRGVGEAHRGRLAHHENAVSLLVFFFRQHEGKRFGRLLEMARKHPAAKAAVLDPNLLPLDTRAVQEEARRVAIARGPQRHLQNAQHQGRPEQHGRQAKQPFARPLEPCRLGLGCRRRRGTCPGRISTGIRHLGVSPIRAAKLPALEPRPRALNCTNLARWRWPTSIRHALRRRQHGEEIPRFALRVLRQQLLDVLGDVGAHHEPDVLDWLQALTLPKGTRHEVRDELRKLIGYFENNRHRTDYPSYRQRGWDIGSGPTEAGCKIIGERLKGSGMRWVEHGAAAVGVLRALNASSTKLWDGFWEQPRAVA